MSEIKLLDKVTSDQIAAGEVVQRPVSVVKELLENSIDSGATEIDVLINSGGLAVISVSDNGKGIHSDDLSLSLKRHATSKISAIDDLNYLATMGFRGEALASISSISKMKITSKHHVSEVAYSISVNGGEETSIKKCSRSQGTSVKVLDLFYNVPARRKFLKKEVTEFSHISGLIEKYVIAYPEIRFSLNHNGKKIIKSPGNQNRLDAISSVFPKDLVNNLIEIEHHSADMSIKGYIGNATCSRGDRNKQIFFVNRRYVANSTVSKALDDAYQNILENYRKPIGVLLITISPETFDVNVHPSKKEIKFEDSSGMYRFVKNAVRNTLLGEKISGQPQESQHSGFSTGSFSSEKHFDNNLPANFLSSNSEVGLFDLNLSSAGSIDFNDNFISGNVMQILDTYILVDENGSLAIYDQHALHERILFEKIKSSGAQISTQSLLIPETIFLSASEISMLSGLKEEILNCGFDFEEFGSDCIILRGVPDFSTKNNSVEMFKDVVSDLSNEGMSKKAVNKVKENIYKIVSCRAAIKAGEKLSAKEMMLLLKEAKETTDAWTCPHGRPTRVSFSQFDMEKLFHRR